MRRETQNILLVLLGGALLKIALNGSYLNYVKPAQRPWLIGAGAVVLALAVLAIVRDVVRAPRPSSVPTATTASALDAHGGEQDGHGHAHRVRSPWLLLLPVLAIFLVAPPALGADSVNRAGTGSAPPLPPSELFPPLPQGDPLPMTMSDLVTRAGYDRSGALDRRVVRLTGFVVHQSGQVQLARLVITCCAADAMPLRARLTGGGLDALRDDEWIELTGVLRPGSAGAAEDYVPTVTVRSVREVSAPADPYEY